MNNNSLCAQQPKQARSLFGFRAFTNDKIISLTVLLNALVLFLDSFPNLHSQHGDSFHYLGLFLSILFVIEITSKLIIEGVKGYFSKLVNCFDFIVASLILYYFLFSFSHNLTASDVVLLRLIRTVKLIQTFKFVPHQKRVYEGLVRATKATGAVLLMLFSLLFIYSMIGTIFFGSILPEHFGDPLKAMYSVFSIFMIEGWNTIPDAAVENGLEYSSWIKAYFILVLVSGGVIGMSLANAIFIDEMVMDNNDELEKKVDQLIQQQEKLLNEIVKLKANN